MAREVELKLRINSKDAPHFVSYISTMGSAVSKPVTSKLLSIYYDTPALTLMDEGVSLRVRKDSTGWTQNVKAIGAAMAGLHKRSEWESSVAGNQPDFTKLFDPALVKIFALPNLRSKLFAVFRIDIKRSVWLFTFDNGDKVEIALDLGRLEVGNDHEEISEIELELKSGKAGRLFAIGVELQKVAPLWLENKSKAQRGYAYYRVQLPSVFKASLPKLNKQDSADKAFKTIAWACINQVQRNQDAVLFGTDIEGLHQMRVSLRRFRSLLKIFRSMLGKEEIAEYLKELGWLSEKLGQARDLDVFVTQTMPALLEHFKHHHGLLSLLEKAVTANRLAYDEVRSILKSQRYNQLVLTLTSWVENEQWRENCPFNTVIPVHEVAKSALNKRYKNLLPEVEQLMEMHPEERHATRILAKKMRYAAEFFASLYSPEKSKTFILYLSQLQDSLGILNDIATTEKLVDLLIKQNPTDAFEETRQIFSGWNACDAMHSFAGMNEIREIFIQQKPFWC